MSSKQLISFRKANLSSPAFPERKEDATADERFIVDSWVKAWRDSPWAGTVPNNEFFQMTLRAIRQLAARGMELVIAESPEIGTYIGFIAFERAAVPVLHFVYVKYLLREHGFGRQLLSAAGISETDEYLYTHRTTFSKYLGGTHYPAVARRKNLEPIVAKTALTRTPTTSKKGTHDHRIKQNRTTRPG